jgi:hypothetical protein
MGGKRCLDRRECHSGTQGGGFGQVSQHGLLGAGGAGGGVGLVADGKADAVGGGLGELAGALGDVTGALGNCGMGLGGHARRDIAHLVFGAADGVTGGCMQGGVEHGVFEL